MRFGVTNYFAETDLSRLPFQTESAGSAQLHGHIFMLGERLHDTHQMILRDPVCLTDLGRRYKPLPVRAQVDEHAQGVIGVKT